MGARGYAKGRRPKREERYQPPKCVRHERRQASVWASFGKAPGMAMCDQCHNHLIGKWKDPEWVKSLHGDRPSAERVVLDTLQREVA